MARASLVLMALFAACRPPGANPESKPSEVDSGEPAAPAAWELIAEHPRAALMGVTGSGEDDVWAVGADDGEGGLILNWDGAAWARVPNADRHDLWWSHAFSPDEVFAVGAGGTVLRGGRSGFTRMSTPGLGAQTLYGAWGSAPDDLWAVGGFAGRWGFLWHFDGEAWVEQPLPDDLPLSPDGELPALFKVWGRAADDVWAVGSHGTVLHFDGAAWEVVPSGTDELLFTVHARNGRLAVVGPRTVLVEEGGAFTNVSPDGAGILQGVCVEDDGSIVISGQSGTMWVRDPAGAWAQQTNTTGVSPESLHAVWTAPSGARWAAGGAVLSAALDQGVIVHQGAAIPRWTAPEPEDPGPAVCPDEAIDPAPGGSVARGWNELALDGIRRDIPRPGVHARNLYHLSVAMWDAWAVYDEVADPMLGHPRVLVADPAEREEARATAISMAAYRVLAHRYPGLGQAGGELTGACLDAHLEQLGLDPADARTTGDDPVAVGNRIGQAVIDTFADDGANEAEDYADTTGWAPLNPPLIVDQPGNDIEHPDDFQLLNLAAAETQNGIVLDSGLQSYIGAQWGQVTPFALPALGERDGAHAWIIPDAPYPSVDEPSTVDEVLEVLRKHAALDATLPETIDISPGAYGNNPLGSNAGTGHPVNPVTGLPYAENIVPLGDFVRVLAEVWADGPKSETPPGHWNSIANSASDAMEPDDLVIAETGRALDRLGWDVHLYLGLNGALHDAAIAAWGLKRESLGARPISLARWMADRGQRSDPSLPSYHPDGLPLEEGVVELITEESAAPGQRHHHLRWFIGEVAVRSWRGEPGDRANVATGVAWMRAREWFPYQRRTFVTPAFPGYVSGHSTFSRAAAELLTRFTGSPYFPGGLGSYTAPAHAQLVFEDGPSVDVVLQWATYQDAADQAGQSRLWGGIHVWADDRYGRTIGHEVGHLAADAALPWFDGTAVVD